MLVKKLVHSAVARQVKELVERIGNGKISAWKVEETNGTPVCPHCGCQICYEYTTWNIFKCKACRYQFSGTLSWIYLLPNTEPSGPPALVSFRRACFDGLSMYLGQKAGQV